MVTKQWLEERVESLKRQLTDAQDRMDNLTKKLDMETIPDLPKGSTPGDAYTYGQVIERVRAMAVKLADWSERNYGNRQGIEEYERRAVGVGNLLSLMFDYCGTDILLAAAVGLEDANWHDDAKAVMALYQKDAATYEVVSEDTPDGEPAPLQLSSGVIPSLPAGHDRDDLKLLVSMATGIPGGTWSFTGGEVQRAERLHHEGLISIVYSSGEPGTDLADAYRITADGERAVALLREKLYTDAVAVADREIIIRSSKAQMAYLAVLDVWGPDHALTQMAMKEYIKLDAEARPAQVRQGQQAMQAQIDAMDPAEFESTWSLIVD